RFLFHRTKKLVLNQADLLDVVDFHAVVESFEPRRISTDSNVRCSIFQSFAVEIGQKLTIENWLK
ncbi:unnamed protein product, partial [Musa acuminata subsp. burmannicoides]